MNTLSLWIGRIMLGCISISVLIILYGLLCYLYQHGHDTVDFSVFRGEPEKLDTFRGIWYQVRQVNPLGIMQFGLVTVVAGQIIRVLLTGAIFVISKEIWMSVFTVIILVMMLYGLM